MTGRGVRVVALASAFLVACSWTRDCSDAGCPYDVGGPAVLVDMPERAAEGARLVVCVESVCSEAVPVFGVRDVPDDVVALAIPDAEDGDEVTVTLSAPDGPDLVGTGTVRSSRPNGEGCGPVCRLAEVSLEG